MNNMRITFGIPDTLVPLGFREVWSCLWLGFTGLLLLTLSLFPKFIPHPWGSLLVLVFWLALPARGLFSQLVRKTHTDVQKRISAQVKLYTFIVVGFGCAFTLWARQIGLSWPVVIGALFLIEALASVIVSLTEWWRLSTFGLSLGLMICGFGFPFVDKAGVGVLIGAGVFFGSLLSACILYWQMRRHQVKHCPIPQPGRNI
jgi:hypothetical protein